jgi:hypothetical protein
MCMLSFYPENVMPEVEFIRNGADVNPDGHGYAIVTDKGIIVGRSMNPDQLIDEFMVLRAEYRTGPALFHSRIATSGTIDLSGCHPFYVGRSSDTVVAHNGHFFQPQKGDSRSDTRIFAEDIMPHRFRNPDNRGRMRRLRQYAGSYNKLVILTANPFRRRRAYLVNEKSGMWVGSEWHSNCDWCGVPKKPTVVSQKMWWDDIDDISGCLQCGEQLWGDEQFCARCGFCQDCKQQDDHCLCFRPWPSVIGTPSGSD